MCVFSESKPEDSVQELSDTIRCIKVDDCEFCELSDPPVVFRRKSDESSKNECAY